MCPHHDLGGALTGPRAYHQVPVAEVVQEAGDACSLVLAVPPDLAGAFAYRPGQFLTVRVPDGAGGSVARCYSLSSSPHAGDAPAITIKRMTGGYASNWIADNVRPGMVLDLLPPAGTFVPQSLHRGAAAVAPDPPVAGAPVVGTASLERAARAGWAALPERTARLARARHGQWASARAARFAATSASQPSTARVVSTSNS